MRTVSFHRDTTDVAPFQCSVSCGVGIQQRDISCQVSGVGRVSDAMCSRDLRPASARHCQLPACLRYRWLPQGWQNVSKVLSCITYRVMSYGTIILGFSICFLFFLFFFPLTFGCISSSCYAAE